MNWEFGRVKGLEKKDWFKKCELSKDVMVGKKAKVIVEQISH